MKHWNSAHPIITKASNSHRTSVSEELEEPHHSAPAQQHEAQFNFQEVKNDWLNLMEHDVVHGSLALRINMEFWGPGHHLYWNFHKELMVMLYSTSIRTVF